MRMKNISYDTLKMIVIGLTALGAFYATLATLWGFPYGVEIAGTLSALATLLSAFLKKSSDDYYKNPSVKEEVSDPLVAGKPAGAVAGTTTVSGPSQKLVFPFKKAMIICGYKTAEYKKSWGYNHFGIDISSYQGYSDAAAKANDHNIYASGNGKVVVCTYDKPTARAKSLGWCLAIRYDNCEDRNGNKCSLIARYMHMNVCNVKLGDTVTLGTKLGEEGMVGTSSYHLHFELDTDVQYPAYSPQVSYGHSGWKVGNSGAGDTTVNPSLWLWVDSDHTQSDYTFTNRNWINTEDTNLPNVLEGSVVIINEKELKAQIQALQAEVKSLKYSNTTLENKHNNLIDSIESNIEKYK